MSLNKTYDLLRVFRDDTQEFSDLSMSDLGLLDMAVGTFTPTLSALTNLDSVGSGAGLYIRLGSIVLFSFSASVDPTAAAAYTFFATLPVASNFGASTDAHGTVSGSGSSLGHIVADAATDKVVCAAVAGGTAASTVQCVGMYRII